MKKWKEVREIFAGTGSYVLKDWQTGLELKESIWIEESIKLGEYYVFKVYPIVKYNSFGKNDIKVEGLIVVELIDPKDYDVD